MPDPGARLELVLALFRTLRLDQWHFVHYTAEVARGDRNKLYGGGGFELGYSPRVYRTLIL